MIIVLLKCSVLRVLTNSVENISVVSCCRLMVVIPGQFCGGTVPRGQLASAGSVASHAVLCTQLEYMYYSL